MQALPATPESICIVEMGGHEKEGESAGTSGQLFLNIGLTNGVLLRTVLDPVTGDLADTRTRYLGSRPVKLFRVKTQNNEAVLAVSSRTWLSYYFQNRFHLRVFVFYFNDRIVLRKKNDFENLSRMVIKVTSGSHFNWKCF